MGETSTRTRDMLRIADDKLAKMKTSTRTREELKKVEEEILKVREKETSAYTLEVFKKKQELLRKL